MKEGAHYETATLSSIELLPKEAVRNIRKGIVNIFNNG